jgi:hypothetical protein
MMSAYKIFWVFVFPVKGAFNSKDKRKLIKNGFYFWSRSAARHTVDFKKIVKELKELKFEKEMCCVVITDKQFGMIRGGVTFEVIEDVATRKQMDESFDFK